MIKDYFSFFNVTQEKKKEISSMLHFIFLLYPSVKIRQVYVNENSKYEKWTYVNDQRLVSFFIYITRSRPSSTHSHFLFDNWLRIKWRIEEESKCLRQKLDEFFLFYFFCCLLKIFISEVCVNTCRRKYCVSKIDKISFQFCFSSNSLTSPKKKKLEVTLYEYLFVCLILRLHIHLDLHLIFIKIRFQTIIIFLSREVTSRRRKKLWRNEACW
jgi:hypothetical protein